MKISFFIKYDKMEYNSINGGNMEEIKKIGNTPIVKYEGVFLKLESFNPGGSIKDRPAEVIINSLPDDVKIVEASSGNMGISLAYLGQKKNMEVVIIMPENMSRERIEMMEKYNAIVRLTPKAKGMSGAIELAKEYQEKGYVWINQFANELNVKAHHQTALEILKQLPNVDVIVCGIGTGGTITGIAEVMKSLKPSVRIVGVEPDESAAITKGQSGIHGIQGIGAGFIPDILNLDLIDEVKTVKSVDAIKMAKVVSECGYSVGISSGAAILIAKEIAKDSTKTILAICPDGKEKYVSVL